MVRWETREPLGGLLAHDKIHLSRTNQPTQELPTPLEGSIADEQKLRRLHLLKVLPTSKTTTLELGFQHVGDEPNLDQRRYCH